MQILIGILIFLGVFYLIITEKMQSTWAALLGGVLMSVLGIIDEEKAIESISERLEILLFLIGMMIMVLIISQTGVFQWISITLSQLAKGAPFKILVLLSLVTAVSSAFLDNVTTILLIIPISILISNLLKLDPFPFIITEIMAANIGGMATMIGDPPQLIIASEAKLTFGDFLINTTPISIICMVFLLIVVYLMYGRKMKVESDDIEKVMRLDASRAITDKKLLKQGSIIFIFVILGLTFNFILNIGLAIISLFGAVLLVIVAKKTPKETLSEVEWEAVFFFIGLFMMVKGLEDLKIVEYLGENMLKVTGGAKGVSAFSIMWISAGVSSFFGNIATSTAFSKIISSMIVSFPELGNTNILWWALSFGTCLGGNITILASVSNMVAMEVSSKAGYKIKFLDFLKFGGLISVGTLIISTLYTYVRYL